MSCQVINHLPNIENKSYLELGVFKNYNFNSIKASNKFSVDLNGKALYTGTTDEYFSSIDSNVNFDIIFIDANHDYDFVLRDFNNAVDHCNEWILIHDMIPPTKEHAQSHLCSDSYKLLYYFLKEEHFQVYPMDENFGLTLIKMPAKKVFPSDLYKNASYEEFVEFIKNIKLYSQEEVIKILREDNV